MDDETKELVARGHEYGDPAPYAKKETANYALVRLLVAKVEEQARLLEKPNRTISTQKEAIRELEEQATRARTLLKPYGYTDSVSLQWIEYDHIAEARRNFGEEL